MADTIRYYVKGPLPPIIKIVDARIVTRNVVLVVSYKIVSFPGFPPFINHDYALVKNGKAIEDTWTSRFLPNFPLKTYTHKFSFKSPGERAADQAFIGIYFAGFIGQLIPGWIAIVYLNIR